MNTTTLFVSYNPKSDLEQTLAVRLHTIGAVNGFRMYLPDRYNSNSKLDFETKRRINDADYFIMFSTIELSKIVLEEINYAFNQLKDKSKIIVVYDKRLGKNLTGNDKFTSLHFNPYKDDQENFLKKILNTVKTKEQRNSKKLKEENQALKALLGIGIGLFVLSSLTAEN